MQDSHPELKSLKGVAGGDAFQTFKFPGQGQQETPVAAVREIVELLFLVPGRRAAAFRRSVADVFVRYVGGDPLLLEEVEKAAHVQNFLKEHCPEHPATAFGEAVESLKKRSREEALTPFAAEEQALKLRRLQYWTEEAQAVAEAAKERAALARAGREEGEKAARAASELAVIQKEEAAKLARLRTLQAGLNAGEACAALRLPPSASLRAVDEVQTMMFGATARGDEALGAPLCLQAELRRASLPATATDASALGKRVKAHFDRLFPGEALGTRMVYVNGQEVATKAYFERHRPAVEAALEEHRAAAAASRGRDAPRGVGAAAGGGLRLIKTFFGKAEEEGAASSSSSSVAAR